MAPVKIDTESENISLSPSLVIPGSKASPTILAITLPPVLCFVFKTGIKNAISPVLGR